ncbi:MAG: bifunctional demethylmenaquinone methyltransferase/2-methoxy-6-polyprenyl-1,4-benzoquinol methylase UbiE [Prevotellaceae bacterium]|jgi:demethylmenaquinone methyltransferase/2-methoxy-6-polyprenyl-1,4-benzoquinol methylase|nr:bifunctional demethylmenaquinone methyltransferase/2-methoxy-6-polyprenyl-1,4-benzoquinol methylase UbiE [Prevotellaceae bacterium]
MEKHRVAEMFDGIACRYDFLNRLLSAGVDRSWRRKLVQMLEKQKPLQILDVAAGTGDLAIACASIKPAPNRIIGIDISTNMLEKGREKVAMRGLDKLVNLQYGDGEKIAFDDCAFDALTIAFGLRNFENPEQGLKEMNRVLRRGGVVYILEFSMPRKGLAAALYRLYFTKILPSVGRIFSGHSTAYGYLPNSVGKFPRYEALLDMMRAAGFEHPEYRPLTFGIATIYTGIATDK